MRPEHVGMDETADASAPTATESPETLSRVTLAAAAKLSGVSEVTLRKHLQAGRLPATKQGTGRYGASWAIDPAELAAFIGGRYGRAIDLAALPPQDSPEPPQDLPRLSPIAQAKAESALRERLAAAEAARDEACARIAGAEAGAAELRERMEATLEDLGKYRALVEAAEHADKRVEGILGERIAELQHERDTAQEKAAAAEEAAAAERAKAEEAAAELARVKSRGFFARLFGGAG